MEVNYNYVCLLDSRHFTTFPYVTIIKLPVASLVGGVVVRVPPCNVRALGSIPRWVFLNIFLYYCS